MFSKERPVNVKSGHIVLTRTKYNNVLNKYTETYRVFKHVESVVAAIRGNWRHFFINEKEMQITPFNPSYSHTGALVNACVYYRLSVFRVSDCRLSVFRESNTREIFDRVVVLLNKKVVKQGNYKINSSEGITDENSDAQ